MNEGDDGASRRVPAPQRRASPDPDAMVASRPIYKGRIVDLAVDSVRFPDGSRGELELIRHSGAAAVLPVLSDAAGADPVILLIRQYRYAAGGPIIEVPAGRPDEPGEDWDACARRELEEETGLVAAELTYLTTIFTTPGFTDEQIHLFLATGLRTGTRKLDADEFVETVTLPLSEALESIRDGRIRDAKTVCTLLYAAGFLLG
jgi:ADP-ribose pyrophosphatase